MAEFSGTKTEQGGRSAIESLDLDDRLHHRPDEHSMVTHDPAAASHADLVVFLRDGRLVGRLQEPTPDLVLDNIRALEA